MGRRTIERLTTSIALFVCVGAESRQVQPPPQFRAGVTLVPVEVRVVDKDGNSVTDLTAADFEIRERGLLQKVEHFRGVSVDESPSAAGRTFLIVLGRGRLNQPTKALQALLDFVRSKSLSRDRVGVVAYLRVIDPTTNRDGIAEFLEAYRDRHEGIDGMLSADLRQAAAGSLRPLRIKTKSAIDELFQSTGLAVRDLSGAAGNGADQFNDFRYLRNSLEYLRSIDGQKHAVLVSERPFAIGVVEEDPLKNFWFRLATAARASLSYIHAGGHTDAAMSRGRLVTRLRSSPIPRSLAPEQIGAYAVVAEQTGGLSAFFQFADRPLAALDRSTRFHYLLGYYPSEPLAPDAYRRIAVSVTRPGLRVFYGHGYVAQPAPERSEDYRRAVTDTRLDMAATLLVHPIPRDPGIGAFRWQMRLTAPVWSSSGSGGRMQVTVVFDPRQVTFVQDGEVYLTDLDLVLLADDNTRNVVGEHRLRLNIKLNATDFGRVKREWFTYEATMDATERPAYLRAALYDFKQDRTASTQLRVPR